MRDPAFERQVEQARALPILQVAAQLGIETIRSHARYTQVYCPFHGGDSGVLLHDGRRNLFKCHAGCVPRHSGRGRPKTAFDGIALVMDLCNLDFRAAVAFLVGEATAPVSVSKAPVSRHLSSVAPEPEQPIAPEEIDRLHNRLMLTPEGERALSYLQSRYIERRTVLRWKLGLTPLWEGPLDWLAEKVPGLAGVLVQLAARGLDLAARHAVLRAVCRGTLDERQRHWLAERVDLQQLIAVYGRADHMRSLRLVIPVWADGPPQDGNTLCWGLRYRQVPGLTPDPPLHQGATVLLRASHQKCLVLEVLPDGALRIRPKRDPEAEPQLVQADAVLPDISKCWGRGSVKTLAATPRTGRRFAIAVEGEMDLLSLDQALLGTPLHAHCWLISSTNGAGSFPHEWRESGFWQPFARIFWAYDRDRAGRQALQAIRAQIDDAGIIDAPVPQGKDFNDWHSHLQGQIATEELRQWLGDYAWYAC